jgi:hypothetical protein
MDKRKGSATEVDDMGWVMSSQEVVGVIENGYWAKSRELG